MGLDIAEIVKEFLANGRYRISLTFICKELSEDSYSKGEINGTQIEFCEEFNKRFNTVDKMFEFLNDRYGLGDKRTFTAVSDGKLMCNRLENTEGEVPNPKEMQDFKAGKINLWSATYDISVEWIETHAPTVDEMNGVFGIRY